MAFEEKQDSQIKVIAIPLANGRLCAHFGHCDKFALCDVDLAGKKILNCQQLDAPAHERGVLPAWLRDQGVSLVLAGGMGWRAQNMLAEFGIEVIVGAPAEPPETIVRQFIDGLLQLGENVCDRENGEEKPCKSR